MDIIPQTILFFGAFIFLYALFPYLLSRLFSGKIWTIILKVVLIHYSFAIAYLVYCITRIFTGFNYSLVFGFIVLLVTIVYTFKFTKRQYLTKFGLDANQLQLTYITASFRTHTEKLPIDDIEEIEILQSNWLINYPASINIKYKNDWQSFEVVDEKIREIITEQVTRLKN
jgi:hypothetical protein